MPAYAIYSAGSSIVKSVTDSQSTSSSSGSWDYGFDLWTTELQIPSVTRVEVVDMLQPIFDVLSNEVLILDQLRRASSAIAESVVNVGVSVSKLITLIFNDKTYNSPEAQQIRRHRQLNDVFSKVDKPSNFKFMLETQPKDPKNQFFVYQWVAYQMIRSDEIIQNYQSFSPYYSAGENELCMDPEEVNIYRFDALCRPILYPDLAERDRCKQSIPKYYRWTFKRTCELDIVDISAIPNDWRSVPGCIDDVLQEEVVFTSQVSNVIFKSVNHPLLDGVYSDPKFQTICPYMHFDVYNVVPHYAAICILLLEQLINIPGLEGVILDGMSKESFKVKSKWKSIIDVITMHNSTSTLRQRDVGYKSQFFVPTGPSVYPNVRESKGDTTSHVVPSFSIDIKIGTGTCPQAHMWVASGLTQVANDPSKFSLNIHPQIGIALANFSSQLEDFKASLIRERASSAVTNQLTPLLSPTWKQKDGCFPESRFATGVFSESMYKIRIMQLVSEPGGIYGSSLYVYPKRLPEKIGVIVDENTNEIKGFLDPEYVSINSYESVLNLKCTNCENFKPKCKTTTGAPLTCNPGTEVCKSTGIGCTCALNHVRDPNTRQCVYAGVYNNFPAWNPSSLAGRMYVKLFGQGPLVTPIQSTSVAYPADHFMNCEVKPGFPKSAWCKGAYNCNGHGMVYLDTSGPIPGERWYINANTYWDVYHLLDSPQCVCDPGFYGSNCELECSCLPKYHGMPADRLIDLNAFTISSYQCGDACRAFLNATWTVKEGKTEDERNTTFCVELPQTALRIDPLPTQMASVCETGPYTCRTSEGVIYDTPSCSGCLSCYKDNVLCDVTLTTLADQSFAISTTNSIVRNFSLDITKDLNDVKTELGDTVRKVRNTEESLQQTANAITALTRQVENLRSTTLGIANEQSRAAVATISKTISDRVDTWGGALAGLCATECEYGISFGVFAALWDATGGFGEFMRAVIQDITTLGALFSVTYFPYLFYLRYKEYKEQFVPDTAADPIASASVDVSEDVEQPLTQVSTMSQSRSNRTVYIPRRFQGYNKVRTKRDRII